MNKKTYLKRLDINNENTKLKKENKELIKNEKIVSDTKKLVLKYKQELEKIKSSNNYNHSDKIQTVSVLREVIQDLESILNEQL